MRLALKSDDKTVVCTLDDDSAMLGAYPVVDNMILDVQDDNPSTLSAYNDLSKVMREKRAER